ncbi:hypothetical protein DEO72_LG8g1718 [Vigna unguiculata]|uniref:Uncharacterized protein n=1 Tax=Vigna unguiculata TaxID=3917 RepID=A0A4D6MQJ8_VIGUN|nr:hypothetical protein DEO72_LG8g1718 [Vigna unguiculata]
MHQNSPLLNLASPPSSLILILPQLYRRTRFNPLIFSFFSSCSSNIYDAKISTVQMHLISRVKVYSILILPLPH